MYRTSRWFVIPLSLEEIPSFFCLSLFDNRTAAWRRLAWHPLLLNVCILRTQECTYFKPGHGDSNEGDMGSDISPRFEVAQAVGQNPHMLSLQAHFCAIFRLGLEPVFPLKSEVSDFLTWHSTQPPLIATEILGPKWHSVTCFLAAYVLSDKIYNEMALGSYLYWLYTIPWKAKDGRHLIFSFDTFLWYKSDVTDFSRLTDERWALSARNGLLLILYMVCGS